MACPYGTSKQDSISIGSHFSIIDSSGNPITDPQRNLHVNEQKSLREEISISIGRMVRSVGMDLSVC